MQFRDRIVATLPDLRRFAGALIAPGHVQSCGLVDDLVARAAASVLRERHESGTAVRLALYSAVIRLSQNRDSRQPAGMATLPPPGSFADGLLSLQIQHRAALLLVSLEQFSYEDAAVVLGVSRTFLVAKLSTARQMLARRLEASNERPATHLRLVK
ncbi:MAG: uncharacterized protein JWN07_171 [Hyphomicrobiales bacterium]|nr:uncharacterized protein [Hyphomicrobiales bacterium]